MRQVNPQKRSHLPTLRPRVLRFWLVVLSVVLLAATYPLMAPAQAGFTCADEPPTDPCRQAGESDAAVRNRSRPLMAPAILSLCAGLTFLFVALLTPKPTLAGWTARLRPSPRAGQRREEAPAARDPASRRLEQRHRRP